MSLKVTEDDPPRAIPESEEVIITWLQGGHNGGCIKFGIDDYLYISTGDGGFAVAPDGRNTGQNITDLESSILRIDVNRREEGQAYAIPADNPFVDKANPKFANARGEIWSYGARNPWKISFDRRLGELGGVCRCSGEGHASANESLVPRFRQLGDLRHRLLPPLRPHAARLAKGP